MKNNYTAAGRQKQKLQTRKKILDTARELMNSGREYTLEDVAQEASISRATIYRYYSNIDVLSAEAVLDMQALTPDLVHSGLKEKGFEKRVLEVQDFYNRLTLQNEPAFRKYLSIVVDSSSSEVTRGRRRISSMELLLSEKSIILSEDEKRLLSNTASVLMGMEPILVTKDVCGLSDSESLHTLRWGLSMIIKGVLADKGL